MSAARATARVWVGVVLAVLAGCGERGVRSAHDRGTASQADAALPACEGCNVVLVSIDTLRADHLGTYGYPRPTSPGIDALAARGVVFERALSASFVTADAHMSIFTSLSPSVHGVRNAVPSERVAHRLPEELTTLPEWLRRAGYATAGFTSGGNVAGAYGFDRGMDRYQVHTETRTGVARSLEFARAQHAAGRRFFVFLHTYEAHDPYLPPPETAALFEEPYLGSMVRTREELRAREPDLRFEAQRSAYWATVDRLSPLDRRQLLNAYDAEIRSVDDALVSLWEGLAPLGRTLIVLTSDHGEQFGEHGGYLHNDLYQELLHVPLVVVHPDGPAGLRVGQHVSTLDVAPTLLELLGVTVPEGLQGRSLAALEGLAPRPVFAEKVGEGAALVDGTLKLIQRPGRRPELFDLARDPDEACDRFWRQSPPLGHMQRALEGRTDENRQRLARLSAPADVHALDPQLGAQLRALGYGE